MDKGKHSAAAGALREIDIVTHFFSFFNPQVAVGIENAFADKIPSDSDKTIKGFREYLEAQYGVAMPDAEKGWVTLEHAFESVRDALFAPASK